MELIGWSGLGRPGAGPPEWWGGRLALCLPYRLNSNCWFWRLELSSWLMQALSMK
jgi:hypothetical protein